MSDLPPNDHNETEEVVEPDPQARADILRESMTDILRLESEIAGIREDIKEIKHAKIKGKLGMKLSDFNVVKRAYELEDKDRKMFLDTLREGFAALDIGEQASFLPAFESAGPAEAAE